MTTTMGGPNADVSPLSSAEKILKLIPKFTIEDAGRYMDSDNKDFEF